MMWCPDYACRLMVGACKSNQRIATEASEAILSGEETVFSLPAHYINRMLVCGLCSQSECNTERSRIAFRQSFSTLVDKIERYNEWGADPGVARVKSFLKGRQWRSDNKEQVAYNGSKARINKRIEELRRIIDGKERNTDTER